MKKGKSKKQSNSKAPIIVLIALIVLLLAGSGWYFLSRFLFFNGTLISRDVTELAVPDGDLPTEKVLSKLPNLTLLDVSGRTDTDTAVADTLKAALPAGAELLWDVPLTDGRFSSRSTALTLPGCTESDVAKFSYFPALTAVDASGSTAYSALYDASVAGLDITYTLPVGDTVLSNKDISLTATGVSDVSALYDLLSCFPLLTDADFSGSTVSDEDMLALWQAYPNITFHWTVHMGDKAISSDETAPDLTGVTFTSAEEAIEKLTAFANLTAVDLCGTGLTNDDARTVKANFSGVTFRYDIVLGNVTVPSDAEEIDLTEETVTSDEITAALSDMPSVKTVYLPLTYTAADGDALAAAFPQVTFIREITLFNQTFRSDVKELDISGTAVTVEEVTDALNQLPYLEKFVMCDCGPDNAAMETLMAQFPNVKFVWNVQIGPHTLRTDATGFSTKNPSKHYTSASSAEYIQQVKTCVRLNEGDIEALKYCTDLVALDLGHNYLTDNDLTVIAGLTHLKILILADNKITDVSALSALTELEYIELFMNKITDISPICGIATLTDVNICNIGLKDVEPLKNLTNCKRLWFGGNKCSTSAYKEVAAVLTANGCECNYSVTNATEGGWREIDGTKVERYVWVRSFFD